MTRETKLRLLGGCILLFNLTLIGLYDLHGLPVLLLTFGFAAGYELLVVRREASPGRSRILVLAGATLALVVMASFFRYQIVTPGGNQSPYKLDRWTGETTQLYGSQERPVVRVEPKPPVDWSQYEPVKPAPTHEASQKTVDPVQERLAAAPPPVAAVTPPAAKNQAEAHYAEIYAVHPDADRIAESPSFAQWLRGRPNYQFVMQKGTAGQVIAVFSEFKAQRTNQQPLDLTYDPNWKSPSRP